MKGLELSKAYYEAFGKQMIHDKFPELEKEIAIGLVGSGSECYGYDDEISKDHDFEPGFCMFVPPYFDEKTIFKLERAYASLPSEYLGYKRRKLTPIDEMKYGVIRIDEFYKNKIGYAFGFETLTDWLKVEEFYILEATNGEVFKDDLGVFSIVRNNLKNIPQDVILKKLAGNLFLMHQSGMYNFTRMIQRNDLSGAQVSLFEFVKHAINCIYLLNNTLMPYYKWMFKGLDNLTLLNDLKNDLSFLILNNNDKETIIKKQELISLISERIISELINKNYTKEKCSNLDTHAYSVNNQIKDPELRNLNILQGI